MKTLKSLPREKRQWYFKNHAEKFIDWNNFIERGAGYSHWSKSATNANRNNRVLDKKMKRKKTRANFKKEARREINEFLNGYDF